MQILLRGWGERDYRVRVFQGVPENSPPPWGIELGEKAGGRSLRKSYPPHG